MEIVGYTRKKSMLGRLLVLFIWFFVLMALLGSAFIFVRYFFDPFLPYFSRLPEVYIRYTTPFSMISSRSKAAESVAERLIALGGFTEPALIDNLVDYAGKDFVLAMFLDKNKKYTVLMFKKNKKKPLDVFLGQRGLDYLIVGNKIILFSKGFPVDLVNNPKWMNKIKVGFIKGQKVGTFSDLKGWAHIKMLKGLFPDVVGDFGVEYLLKDKIFKIKGNFSGSLLVLDLVNSFYSSVNMDIDRGGQAEVLDHIGLGDIKSYWAIGDLYKHIGGVGDFLEHTGNSGLAVYLRKYTDNIKSSLFAGVDDSVLKKMLNSDIAMVSLLDKKEGEKKFAGSFKNKEINSGNIMIIEDFLELFWLYWQPKVEIETLPDNSETKIVSLNTSGYVFKEVFPGSKIFQLYSEDEGFLQMYYKKIKDTVFFSNDMYVFRVLIGAENLNKTRLRPKNVCSVKAFFYYSFPSSDNGYGDFEEILMGKHRSDWRLCISF